MTSHATDKQVGILRRFFEDNMEAVKSLNGKEDFEVTYEHFLDTKKRKKVKLKVEPEFKGFTEDDQKKSRVRRLFVDQAVIRNQSRMPASEDLMELCDKINQAGANFKEAAEDFLGFSKQEQVESKLGTTNLTDRCNMLSASIYKNIDRRILRSHVKTDSNSEIYSKYFCSDSKCNLKQEATGEEPTLKQEDVEEENDSKAWNEQLLIQQNNKSFIKFRNKSVPDIDLSQLDRENVILAEIEKLNQELTELRKIKYAASEGVKLQKSPFIQIKKELIMTPFIPPKSPHRLIEEDLYHDPWALLVSTIFLNKTSCAAARPYVFWFLEENPDPLTVVGKNVEQLEMYFGALGLKKTRAIQVWKMSHDFLYKEWKKVGELYGISTYGEDAFRMFCLGDFSVKPKDRFLKIYKAWYEMQEKNSRLSEMNV